jgi:hypothetical protein
MAWGLTLIAVNIRGFSRSEHQLRQRRLHLLHLNQLPNGNAQTQNDDNGTSPFTIC